MASINDLAIAAIATSTEAVASKAAVSPEKEATAPSIDMDDEQLVAPESAITRGALVILEGLDRSGKTTQVKLLEQRFVELGKKVKVMRFPDRSTPIGQMIDAYLKSSVEMDDHVIHLLFSANRWEAVKTIRQLLASGTTILCDRYYHSGIVYSAAKHNPSLSLHWARAPDIGLPRPDLVLFLDLDEATAKSRSGWGGEVYERGEMQRRVRELFWGLAMGRIGAGGGLGDEDRRVDREFRQEEEDLVVVDAGASVEEVAEGIWEKVQPRVELVEKGQLRTSVRSVA